MKAARPAFSIGKSIPAGGSVVLRLRLTPEQMDAPLKDVDQIIAERKADADEFYNFIQPPKATEDELPHSASGVRGFAVDQADLFV